MDRPGQNLAPTKARLVTRRIRPTLSRPFTNNHLASTSNTHMSIKQDQVLVVKNRLPRSTPSQVIEKAVTLAFINNQSGELCLSYAPVFLWSFIDIMTYP